MVQGVGFDGGCGEYRPSFFVEADMRFYAPPFSVCI